MEKIFESFTDFINEKLKLPDTHIMPMNMDKGELIKYIKSDDKLKSVVINGEDDITPSNAIKMLTKSNSEIKKADYHSSLYVSNGFKVLVDYYITIVM